VIDAGHGQIHITLADRGAHLHALGMFVVSEADAVAIRAAFDQAGELSAVVELRRRFPGITDNVQARACVRTITGWRPLSETPPAVARPPSDRNR
jgi:hypothetical protein